VKRAVVVFGLSGTGKSFVARILSEEFGYRWIRSDEIRKELAGLQPHTRASAPYGEGIYTEEMTRLVYREMVARAMESLKKGERVVLDATFLKRWQRDLVRERIPEAFFIRTLCDEEVVRKRLTGRVDISDADVSIYRKQKEEFEQPFKENWVELNTDTDYDELVRKLKDLVEDC